jgi:hypothetical protein
MGFNQTQNMAAVAAAAAAAAAGAPHQGMDQLGGQVRGCLWIGSAMGEGAVDAWAMPCISSLPGGGGVSRS